MQIRLRRPRFAASLAALSSLMLAVIVLSAPVPSFAQIGVAIMFGPPPIPVYDQPTCPGDGYLWTPGYWAYDYDIGDYYWVPGTWILAPEVGFLWTPGWWGWDGEGFVFHGGYWGPHVGFYGGINYGFGYFGLGFEGGRWDRGHFLYNRAVLNVNITDMHNVYNTTEYHENVNHVSFNGGHGGIDVHPRPEEIAAEHDRHIPPIAAQTEHIEQARSNPQLRASANMGRPPIAATEKPGEFSGHGVAAAKAAGGTYTPRMNARSGSPVHPRDLPAAEHPALPSTGNQKQDHKNQQEQDKMLAKQQQERDRLQQQQEKDHQQLAKRNADDAARQQVELRHQQQTQQLQQKHQQEQQQFQQQVQKHSSPSRK
jgi:hypothetical protein